MSRMPPQSPLSHHQFGLALAHLGKALRPARRISGQAGKPVLIEQIEADLTAAFQILLCPYRGASLPNLKRNLGSVVGQLRQKDFLDLTPPPDCSRKAEQYRRYEDDFMRALPRLAARIILQVTEIDADALRTLTSRKGASMQVERMKKHIRWRDKTLQEILRFHRNATKQLTSCSLNSQALLASLVSELGQTISKLIEQKLLGSGKLGSKSESLKGTWRNAYKEMRDVEFLVLHYIGRHPVTGVEIEIAEPTSQRKQAPTRSKTRQPRPGLTVWCGTNQLMTQAKQLRNQGQRQAANTLVKTHLSSLEPASIDREDRVEIGKKLFQSAVDRKNGVKEAMRHLFKRKPWLYYEQLRRAVVEQIQDPKPASIEALRGATENQDYGAGAEGEGLNSTGVQDTGQPPPSRGPSIDHEQMEENDLLSTEFPGELEQWMVNTLNKFFREHPDGQRIIAEIQAVRKGYPVGPLLQEFLRRIAIDPPWPSERPSKASVPNLPWPQVWYESWFLQQPTEVRLNFDRQRGRPGFLDELRKVFKLAAEAAIGGLNP